jgi:alditol oxidase
MVERNWSGNVEYRPATILRPETVDELRDIVLRAPQIHVLGSRHSFNDIADSDALVSLAGLPDNVTVDREARTVELNPAMTYGGLADTLHSAGLALHNLASLPHISIGGAIATGTHGSGDRLGNLGTIVAALDILGSDGEIVHLERGDTDFAGAVVGLGALGVVLRVRLDTEPEYQVAQRVYQGLAWDQLDAHFDEVTGAGTSVSLFTTWGDVVEQVWVKQRVVDDQELPASETFFGAHRATVDVHPIAGVSAEHCTPQLGVPGRWSDRLPHFRMGFTPSSGDELQSEILLPRESAVAAIPVVRALGGEMAEHLLISEIRTIAGDDAWMSPQHGRDTVAFHFTWQPHAAAVIDLVDRIDKALFEFEPRPHWGKLFTTDRETIASRYPRHRDFVDLIDRYDARGAFRSDWLRRTIVG